MQELLKQPTKYVQRKWRKVQKDTRALTVQLIEQYPEHALNFKTTDLYNFVGHAVYMRNEKMLDDLWAEHELLVPGDNLFRRHIAFNRACIRISERKFEEAIEMLKALEAEGVSNHHHHILLYLIEIYEELNDFISAAPYVHLYLANWDREMRTENNHLNFAGLPHMLNILGRAGEFENVIRIGKERLELYPKDAFLNFLIGQCHLELKDDLRALHYFRKCTWTLHPKYPEIYVNLGAYWNDRQDFPAAIDNFLKAVEASGDDPDYDKLLTLVYRNLANLYKIMHDLDNAENIAANSLSPVKSLEMFDMIVLFGSDMSEYQAWAENHPEVYEEFLGEDDEEDDLEGMVD